MAFVVAALTVVCICCCWNNIKLGAALMIAASEFVASNTRIIATPILSFAICLVFFIWWVVSAMWIYSMGQATAPDVNGMIANIVLDD